MDVNSAEDQHNLFKSMHNIDKKAEKCISEYVIGFFGNTRAGKSTTYNLVVNPQSIVGFSRGSNLFYKNRLNQIKINPEYQQAFVKEGLRSITKQPNIAKIKIKNLDVTVIDFAGFGDRSKCLEVLFVNYAMGAFLKRIINIKFVIVFTCKAFTDLSSNGFVSTMNQFLKQFDFNQFTVQDKQNFYKSVSFIITSSTFNNRNQLIEQLIYVRQMISDLNDGNQQNIVHFQIFDELLKNVIKYQRIQEFLLARINQSPQPKNFIDSFNSSSCNFFDLKKVRQHLKSPYVQQYNNLKTIQQKQYLKNIINKKFKSPESFQKNLTQIFINKTKNLESINFDYESQIKSLQDQFITNSIYCDLPMNGIVVKKIAKTPVDQIKVIEQLIDLSHSVLHITDFKQQNGPQFTIERYIIYLQNNFKHQMQYVASLFYGDQNVKIILNQLWFIFNQLLIESNNFILLDRQFQSYISNHLKQYLNIGLFLQAKDIIKQKFICCLNRVDLATTDYSQQDIRSIIDYTIMLQHSDYLINPTDLYSIGFKFNQHLVQKLKNNNNKQNNRQIVDALFKALIFTFKHSRCLLILKPTIRSQQLSSLIPKQKQIFQQLLEHLFRIFKFQLAIKICSILKQHSFQQYCYNKFITFLQKQKSVSNKSKLIEVIKQAAQFSKLIGNSSQSISLLKKLKTLQSKYGQFCQKQNKQISNSASKMLQKYQKSKQYEQKHELMQQRGVRVINQIIKECSISNSSFSSVQQYIVNFEDVQNNFKIKMKKYLAEEDFSLDLPTNPNNYQRLTLSQRLIQKITPNKNVIFLIGTNQQVGKTTFYHGCSNKNIISYDGKSYDLHENHKNNKIKINHNGEQHTHFPSICPIQDDTLLIDVPFLFDYNKLQKMLTSWHIFQKMMKGCQSFKFIITAKMTHIVDNQGQNLIQLLRFMMKFIKMGNQSRDTYDGQKLNFFWSKAFSLLVTHVPQIKTNMVRQNLKQLIARLKDQNKVVDNQKKYYLLENQQINLSWIIQQILNKGRVKYFYLPTKDNQTPKFDFIQQLNSNQQFKTQWSYVSPQCLQNVSLKVIQSFIDSQINNIRRMIQTKLNTLTQMIKHLNDCITINVDQLLQQKYHPKQDLELVYQQILNCNQELETIGQIHPDQQDQQQPNVFIQCQSEQEKYLHILKGLVKISLYNFREFDDLFLPQAYVEYFNKLIYSFQFILDNIKHLCCKNNAQLKLFTRVQKSVEVTFIELRMFAQIYCKDNKLSKIDQSLRNIRDCQLQIQAMLSYEISQKTKLYCLRFLNIQTCLDFVQNNKSKAQSYLLDYKFILDSFNYEDQINLPEIAEQNQFRMTTYFKFAIILQQRLQNANRLQLIYQEQARNKQKIGILIYQIDVSLQKMAKQFRNDLTPNKQFEPIKDLFRKIAFNLAELSPQDALKLCNSLNCQETKIDVLTTLMTLERYQQKKIQWLKELVKTHMKMKHLQKVRDLTSELKKKLSDQQYYRWSNDNRSSSQSQNSQQLTKFSVLEIVLLKSWLEDQVLANIQN